MQRMMRWGLGVVGLAAAGAIAVAATGLGGSASAQVPPDNQQSRADRYRQLLAEELGISVQQLTNAQTAARNKLIDEAVTAGQITQAQADKLKSLPAGQGPFGFGGRAFGAGVRNAVVSVFQAASDVLGIPVNQLRQQIASGKSLTDIAASKDIDQTTLQSDLVKALTDKINQAVADGTISQDRANKLEQSLDQIVSRAITADGPFQGRFHFGQALRRFQMQNNQN